jgi:hypothetical protein
MIPPTAPLDVTLSDPFADLAKTVRFWKFDPVPDLTITVSRNLKGEMH